MLAQVSRIFLRVAVMSRRRSFARGVCIKDQRKREYHNVVGDVLTPSQIMGIDHLREPRLNKGLAFTLEERQVFGIHGLLPPKYRSQKEQLALCEGFIQRYDDDINKYLYLMDLHDRHEKLFFRMLSENVEKYMPIVYTPTVGQACQEFGLIYRRPRGLFITIRDRGHCFDVLKNWPEPDVRAICVTDGERILGLGDLGACGMGIPVGKLTLYTALGGVKPHQCLPVLLDVGTNNRDYLEDPLYVGLRQPRVTGPDYDDFVDEFMDAVVRRYGQHVLIQFEDFGNHNAFRFLDKYRSRYCTFNDDIQGTASVTVAGLLASRKITNRKLSDHSYLFFGAGEAAIGIADLCVRGMELEGLSTQEARTKIWMWDNVGLLAKHRPEGNLEGHKEYYAKEHAPLHNFKKMLEEVKPSVLIGASTSGGAFTPEVLKMMAEYNDRPIIFALSNPTSKSECTAQAAYTYTEGRCIFSSGSPFPPVTYNGKTFHPGQGNNVYVFPGVALGVICAGVPSIKEELFLLAAQCIADNVTDKDLQNGSLYPPLSAVKEVSTQIAVKICEYAYANGMASIFPEPTDKRQFVESNQYDYHYSSILPMTWRWQPDPYIRTKPMDPTRFLH